MANFISGIISLSISVVVLASVFITTVKNTNTTNPIGVNGTLVSWSSTELSLFGLITLVAIVGMLYGVLNVFGIM